MKRVFPTEAGVGIIEVLVASTLLVLTFTALYALYSAGLKSLSAATKQSIAQTYLNAQVDELRTCGWAALTLSGSSTLPASILADPTDPDSGATLKSLGPASGIIQTLSVYPALYYTGSSTPYYTGSLSATSGTRYLSSVSSSISGQTSLKFVFHLEWKSQGRTYSREYASILTQH